MKKLITILSLTLSTSAFSMISKSDWVSQCQNATGEAKKTFDAINHGKITKGAKNNV